MTAEPRAGVARQATPFMYLQVTRLVVDESGARLGEEVVVAGFHAGLGDEPVETGIALMMDPEGEHDVLPPPGHRYVRELIEAEEEGGDG